MMKRVTTGLVAGVCILAVSITAAFGSVNGYANYKTAVKSLALEADNVSFRATANLTYDGKQIMDGELEHARDGNNQSTHSVKRVNDEVIEESYDTTLNGVNTWFWSDDAYYNSYESGEEGGHGLFRISDDDEMEKRLVNFLEMGVDTVMGDLKNNVVEVGSENGDVTYGIDISRDQVPAVVNAGLSLLAYSMSESAANTQYVDFEDYDLAAFHYYEQKTGQILSDDFKDTYQNGSDDADWWESEEVEQFQEIVSDMYSDYYDILDKQMEKQRSSSGVLYVKNDGTYTFYQDEYAYREAQGDQASLDSVELLIGQDLSLQNVHFTFSLNKAGQLTANHCEATFDTTDREGGHHAMVLQGDVTFHDYGTTVVQPLDVGDRVDANQEEDEAIG